MTNREQPKKSKAYALMPWMGITQAIDYILELTGTPLNREVMLQLCEGGQCSVYMDFSGCRVEIHDSDDSEPTTYAIGKGLSKIRIPLIRNIHKWSGINAAGPVAPYSTSQEIECDSFWYATTADNAPALRFKQEDIQALAKSMNNPADAQTTDDEPKNSHLLLIAALLELARTAEKPRNQAGINSEIRERYPNVRGLGDRQINGLFADANRAATDAGMHSSHND
ncbi:MAG: hypothetical protein WAW12_08315 [Pseudomonas sp.]